MRRAPPTAASPPPESPSKPSPKPPRGLGGPLQPLEVLGELPLTQKQSLPEAATYGYDLLDRLTPGFDPGAGNLIPGYMPQDWICTVLGPLGSYMDSRPCIRQCCLEHDLCYQKYGCNASSWLRPPIGPCQLCNIKAEICILTADKSPNGCSSCGAPREAKENE